MPKKIITTLIVAITLNGCASLDGADVPKTTQSNIERKGSTVEITDEIYIPSVPVRRAPFSHYGDVDNSINPVDFPDIVKKIGKKYSILIEIDPNVDTKKSVTIPFENLSPVMAITEVSRAAGYVAAYNEGHNKIHIGIRGVFTYRLPVVAVGKLERDVLQRIVGDKAQITIDPSHGLVLVEGDAVAQNNIRDFLNKYNAASVASLEIKSAIIAVDIISQDDHGVEWSEIYDAVIEQSSSPSNSAFSISKETIKTLINILRSKRRIDILSQPQVTSTNLQTANLGFSSGVVTRMPQVDYANDSISLRVTPNIIGINRIQVEVISSISLVKEFLQIDDADSSMTRPVKSLSETSNIVTVNSGETIILGGVRTSKKSRKENEVLDRDNILFSFFDFLGSKRETDYSTELWILLNVAIKEMPFTDTLESQKIVSSRE